MTGRRLLRGLVAAHVALICVHLAASGAGLINPWEFGGYGMYTQPYPGVSFEVREPTIDGRGSVAFDEPVAAISRDIHFGGCVFGFSERQWRDVVSAMDARGADHLVVAFRRSEFSDDKSVMLRAEIGRFDAKRAGPDSYEVRMELCGRNRTSLITTD